MSKASEWARRDAQVKLSQPKFECVPWVEDDDPDEKDDAALEAVAQVHETGRLSLECQIISAGDARGLARWILDTFGES